MGREVAASYRTRPRRPLAPRSYLVPAPRPAPLPLARGGSLFGSARASSLVRFLKYVPRPPCSSFADFARYLAKVLVFAIKGLSLADKCAFDRKCKVWALLLCLYDVPCRLRSGAPAATRRLAAGGCGETSALSCPSVAPVDQQAVPSSQLFNLQPHAPLPAWLRVRG